MKKLISVMLLVIACTPMGAQKVTPAPSASAGVEDNIDWKQVPAIPLPKPPTDVKLDLTEVELLRVELIKKQSELFNLQQQYNDTVRELQQAKLQILLSVGTPKRDGYKFDWATQKFVEIKK